MDEAEEPLHG